MTHVFWDVFMNMNILLEFSPTFNTSTNKNLHYFYFVSSFTRCQHIQLSLSRLSHQCEKYSVNPRKLQTDLPLLVSLQRERLRNIERICNLLRKVSRERHQITSGLCCSGSECDRLLAWKNEKAHKMTWERKCVFCQAVCR